MRRPDNKLSRGLSRNQVCIGMGVDDKGRVLAVFEGLGKPSKSRTLKAFGERIEPGSTLVHDKEGSHAVLVDRLGLEDESYDARLLRGIDDELDPLQPVNRVCSLRLHSGFDRDDIQGYLDLFFVAMNAPADKLEKAALVLDRVMRCPITLRFRDFYNVKPGSEGCSEEIWPIHCKGGFFINRYLA